MSKNLKVVYLYFANSLAGTISSPVTFFIFFIAKLFRYGFFLAFLFLLISGLGRVGGYTPDQMLVFYLVFNLIDTAGQMLFREVYRFRPLIIRGGLDQILTKPFSPLFRVLIGGPDFIDVGVLLVLLLVIGWFLFTSIHPSFLQVLTFIFLTTLSLVISASFHIVVLALGILTFTVDHLVMIYRDITSLMRIPVDFFSDSLRALLTFVIPVGIMFTVPAKALLGLLSWEIVAISVVVTALSLFFSLSLWRYSLRHYQSASS